MKTPGDIDGDGSQHDRDIDRVADVIPLRPGASAAGAVPNPEVIARIEAILERAKSGELQAFAMVSVLQSQHNGTEWCAADGWFHEIVSGLSVLTHRFIAENGWR